MCRAPYRNLRRSSNRQGTHYTAWQFAYVTALRIALHEHQPYESGRTIWRDVAERGYGMDSLLDALTTRDVTSIGAATAHVWNETQLWGRPE